MLWVKKLWKVELFFDRFGFVIMCLADGISAMTAIVVGINHEPKRFKELSTHLTGSDKAD